MKHLLPSSSYVLLTLASKALTSSLNELAYTDAIYATAGTL